MQERTKLNIGCSIFVIIIFGLVSYWIYNANFLNCEPSIKIFTFVCAVVSGLGILEGIWFIDVEKWVGQDNERLLKKIDLKIRKKKRRSLSLCTEIPKRK